MGISVSESKAVQQMIEEKEKSKIEKKEKIRSELASPIPHNVSPSSQKQNKSAPNFKNTAFNASAEKPENHRKNEPIYPAQERQKNHNNVQPSNADLNDSPPSKEYKEKKEVTEFVEKYLSRESIPGKQAENQQVKPSEVHQIDQTFGPKEQTVGKESKKQTLKRVSSLSSPDAVITSANNKDFDNYDWQIPSEKDILAQTHNIEALPTMTLVLSNKFTENRGCMDECTDSESANKNRRQIMRDLLAGRRESAENRLLPECGCGNPKLSLEMFQQK